MHRTAMSVAGERKFRDFRRDNKLDTRQFQMAFRTLRQLSVQIDSSERELDIDATIHDTCENGGLLKMQTRPPRKNNVKAVSYTHLTRPILVPIRVRLNTAIFVTSLPVPQVVGMITNSYLRVRAGITLVSYTHLAGCPSAYLTIEQLIFGELTVAIPEIRQVIVVQDVSDELWEEARAVMQGKYENH